MFPQPYPSPRGLFSSPRSPHVVGCSNRTAQLRNHTLSSILANGFPYSRKLVGHSTCVNALVFSSGDGRFLASGGDDLRILLWDFHQGDVKEPSASLIGPKENIFTLAFSATNRYLYSGGTDHTVLKYDISYSDAAISSSGPTSPNVVYNEHFDSVRTVACHPTQDEVFMSASEDGSIRRHDDRTGARRTRAQDILQITSEVTGVQYHPLLEHIFVTSDNSGCVCLRDERMAFGSSTQRTKDGIVQMYNTKLSMRCHNHLSNPESSSVTFDREGSKLAVTMLHYLPTIYALSDPNPVAVCSGRRLPDGSLNPPTQRTYSNSCTMKHGSFGGPGSDHDEFYSAGSDDFRGYVWRIPPLQDLAERRTEISPSEWESQLPHTFAFTENLSATRYVPVELDTPFCRLGGHDSIVNTTVFHPNLLHIATSGVEKSIVIHSPTQFSPCIQDLTKTPTEVRQLRMENDVEDHHTYLRAIAGFHPLDLGDESDIGERTTIRMFDHILREEGEADIFLSRRWRADDSDEDEELELSPTTRSRLLQFLFDHDGDEASE